MSTSADTAAVSPLMQALNQEALSRAQKMLTKKFQDAAALDEISALRSELQAKLSSADAKLKGAVQGPLSVSLPFSSSPPFLLSFFSFSAVCLSVYLSVCLSLSHCLSLSVSLSVRLIVSLSRCLLWWVAGKLDSLKRAVDLMEESSAQLAGLTRQVQAAEHRISLTDTALSAYPSVKRVHFARDNINKVISEVTQCRAVLMCCAVLCCAVMCVTVMTSVSTPACVRTYATPHHPPHTRQVEFFTKIPETVSRLRRLLDEEPHRLKEVYLRGLELQAWRSALLNELLVSSSPEGRGIGPGYQKRVSLTKARSARVRSSAHWEEYSGDMRGRVLQGVGSHLQSVLELSREVKRRLWANIERLSDVAALAPADLVTTFEVIEMHQVGGRLAARCCCCSCCCSWCRAVLCCCILCSVVCCVGMTTSCLPTPSCLCLIISLSLSLCLPPSLPLPPCSNTWTGAESGPGSAAASPTSSARPRPTRREQASPSRRGTRSGSHWRPRSWGAGWSALRSQGGRERERGRGG
jgi:hypothetical protein